VPSLNSPKPLPVPVKLVLRNENTVHGSFTRFEDVGRLQARGMAGSLGSPTGGGKIHACKFTLNFRRQGLLFPGRDSVAVGAASEGYDPGLGPSLAIP